MMISGSTFSPDLTLRPERTEKRKKHQKKTRSNTISDKAVDLILSTIDNNRYDLSVKVIANLLQVNPSYLSRAFKKSINLTLSYYLKIEMIHRALFAFDQGMALSVKDCAARLGYPVVASFISDFARIMLITPGRYLKIKKLWSNR